MAYTTTPHKRLWNMREYYAMAKQGLFENEKVELIEGVILVKSPDGSIHRYTIAKITRYMIKTLPERFYLQPQSSFPLDNYSVPEPDIAIMEGEMEVDMKKEFQEAKLVVEVSFSSLRYDRTKKMKLYAKSGIPEYWIVNLKEVIVEVYRQPNREKSIFTQSEVFTFGQSIVSPFDHIEVPIEELMFKPDPDRK